MHIKSTEYSFNVHKNQLFALRADIVPTLPQLLHLRTCCCISCLVQTLSLNTMACRSKNEQSRFIAIESIAEDLLQSPLQITFHKTGGRHREAAGVASCVVCCKSKYIRDSPPWHPPTRDSRFYFRPSRQAS